MTDRLFSFIKNSPTAYHAVKTVCDRLTSEGFVELSEGENTELCDGKGYFIKKFDSSVIAFRYKKSYKGFMISASHSDSPSFRVKGNGETVGVYNRLMVERYGGSIY